MKHEEREECPPIVVVLAYLSFFDSEAQLVYCQEIVSPTGEHLSITK